ncbi:cell division protein FtsQ [Pseudomonas daroniae]|uniref:Cell division protein FtsQ n=1 Tax=Phytopseudomonas daroniae TaxID=2487519 RepID=A0A4Q9QQ49_9GAMM|nr:MULTISPECIES: cell division protein FtsQ/DivIB [Pseudomonas]TBU78517.1 cell division protein FtsQ [Pseudomonas daroniae]TBU82819.1 cell division protein FtsQ [Pseudomonas daroniae]TBU85981.1 cell division protein FtsQ [Pseudomonas sp. FRB 228]TBU95144.1 cell division protein FtsQ [Pseudomonas daroniae]
MSTVLRHQPGSARAPMRSKAVPRGASRLVAKDPISLRLPRPNFSLLKRITWPVLLLVLGFAAYELSLRLLPYADRPIAKISVEGDLSYISQQSVQRRIEPFVSASFFSVDLVGMRHELERMPWIAHAEVRRVWPDQVMVRLEEQLPIARWGDEALLNNQGQAFAPKELAHYENLPQLYGPKRAQQQVMQQYQVLSQMLRPMGFTVARLELRERGSWFLSTGQGIEVLLGRDHLVEKIRRFGAIYSKALKDQKDNIARIDLRYANGLAVAWHEPPASVAVETAAAQ